MRVRDAASWLLVIGAAACTSHGAAADADLNIPIGACVGQLVIPTCPDGSQAAVFDQFDATGSGCGSRGSGAEDSGGGSGAIIESGCVLELAQYDPYGQATCSWDPFPTQAVIVHMTQSSGYGYDYLSIKTGATSALFSPGTVGDFVAQYPGAPPDPSDTVVNGTPVPVGDTWLRVDVASAAGANTITLDSSSDGTTWTMLGAYQGELPSSVDVVVMCDDGQPDAYPCNADVKLYGGMFVCP